MAKTKQEKAAIIEKLEKGLKDASSAVFVHFSKLSVADETAVRRSLSAEGITYTVAKKTFIRRALEALKHTHEELPLEGEIAVVIGTSADTTAPARLIHEAAKKLADKLSIVGGIFEGKIVGEVMMREIATIPSMDTLRGMFAQVINSPRQRFAVVLSEVAKTKN